MQSKIPADVYYVPNIKQNSWKEKKTKRYQLLLLYILQTVE